MAVALPDDVKQYVDDPSVFATLATILPDGQPHLTVVWVKPARIPHQRPET
jgi:hypothetical protein